MGLKPLNFEITFARSCLLCQLSLPCLLFYSGFSERDSQENDHQPMEVGRSNNNVSPLTDCDETFR